MTGVGTIHLLFSKKCVVKNIDYEVKLPGSNLFSPFIAREMLTSYLAFLFLGSFICKIEMIMCGD